MKRKERKHNVESGHEKGNYFFFFSLKQKKKIIQEKGKLKVRKYGSVKQKSEVECKSEQNIF